MQRNIQLLKERGWFDIPIVYNNGRRAILSIEKGSRASAPSRRHSRRGNSFSAPGRMSGLRTLLYGPRPQPVRDGLPHHSVATESPYRTA